MTILLEQTLKEFENFFLTGFAAFDMSLDEFKVL